MELGFYQVSHGNLASSAVKLLEKVYLTGKRCIFYSPMVERVRLIDKTLWTFSTNAFIPHGDKSLGFPEKQPIYFTSEIENPNNATVAVLVDTLDYKVWPYKFEKMLFIFEDSALEDTVKVMYKGLQTCKENVNYWRQSAKGWEKVN
ncbi:MAG: hypothetical protein E7015_00440 [Alphaproteobacteria bacterium]|nr:hypothetical protein [Alphaproteobacteria bacterium]